MAIEQSYMKPALTAIVAILAGAAANILWAPQAGSEKLFAWLVTIVMAALLCACIGKAIAGQWHGVLIDARNRVSLSRLQMFAWTLIVLSALITAASSNLALADNGLALSIDIPDPLLAAMGIATASLVATPALLTLKAPDPNTGASAVASHDKASQASWLDMFRGDDEADAARPDLSKIQQFLITLALVGGYAVLIGDKFRHLAAGTRFESFPLLDDKFVWLLGISHAGYLTYKAVPKPAAPGAANGANPLTPQSPEPPGGE
jgi:hypothetical protein